MKYYSIFRQLNTRIQENHLSATRDQYYATANMYDASGNRAWTLRLRSAQALGGEVNWMWNNGQGWQAYGDLNLRICRREGACVFIVVCKLIISPLWGYLDADTKC